MKYYTLSLYYSRIVISLSSKEVATSTVFLCKYGNRLHKLNATLVMRSILSGISIWECSNVAKSSFSIKNSILSLINHTHMFTLLHFRSTSGNSFSKLSYCYCIGFVAVIPYKLNHGIGLKSDM